MKPTLIFLITLLTGAFLFAQAQDAELAKVRVLVTYNNHALDAIMDDSQSKEQAINYIETKAISDITNSNLVLENSEVHTFKWEIAGIIEIPIPFPKNEHLSEDDAFASNNPEIKEFILNACGASAADQLILYANRGANSAIAGLAGNFTTEYPMSSIVMDVDYTTTTHELWHNLQLLHARYQSDMAYSNRGPNAYNFGYRLELHGYLQSEHFEYKETYGNYYITTIMGYGQPIPFFSNPQLMVTATAMNRIRDDDPINPGYYYIPSGTINTYQLGVPQGVPDAPDIEAAFALYKETKDENVLLNTSGSYGAADAAKVLRQTGPILARMHDEMTQPQIISSTLYTPPPPYNYQTIAEITATGENLTVQWTQSGSQTIVRADDSIYHKQYSVYNQPYPWNPDETCEGLPGQDYFRFYGNPNQSVTVTVSNPVGSTSLVLTPTTSGTTSGTSSGTGGGNTGGNNTGGSNSGGGGGGGGAPSSWMLLGLAILAACRGNRKTGSPT
jgi:uncharacterized membrane protein YgcG